MDWTSLIVADIARLLQYAGASVLFGTALFNLISLPRSGPASATLQGWPKPLFLVSGIALLAGAILSLLAQSATMNGVPLTKLDAAGINLVLTQTQWGHAIAVRMGLSLLAVLLGLLSRPSNPVFMAQAAIGLVCLASFAFTGHGASDDGAAGLIHLVSDMIHAVAAGVWTGTLAGFFALLARSSAIDEPHRPALAKALADFATTGTVVVAALVITGLINSYFIIGVAGLPKLLASAYGDLLAIKLLLFVAMLALAAKNRFRLTPALVRATDPLTQRAAISALRQSVTFEALASLAILGLVAVFGMMEPPGTG
jgi:putative copper resistance protein D